MRLMMQLKKEKITKIHQEIEHFFDSAIATKEDLKKGDDGYVCQECKQIEIIQNVPRSYFW